MIYNPKKVDNRRFKAVSLPSCRKLFERFGYTLGEKGHPDNTDPYNFTEPKFKSGVKPNDVVNSTLISGVSKAYKETTEVESIKDESKDPKEVTEKDSES